jgi:acetolactate decarboxylase
MWRRLLLIFLSTLIFQNCNVSNRQPVVDTIYQVSVLDALMAGVYDGNTTFQELKTHGDFGLGTLHALDGEMVYVDGTFYQISSAGIAHRIADTLTTPFAVVTFFDADTSFTLESVTKTGLLNIIDDRLRSLNIPVAIKIVGNFNSIRTRSVPRQQKPYPPLLDVFSDQPEFIFENTAGTLAGFRLPEYMQNINAAGYHFHFITEDKSAGGHLLDCEANQVTVEIDYKQMLKILIPDDIAFRTVELQNQAENYR